jgi:hypothetical protein
MGYFTYRFLRALWYGIKGVLRFSLRLGRITGISIRRFIGRFVRRVRDIDAQLQLPLVAVLLIFGILCSPFSLLPPVQAKDGKARAVCNSNQIVTATLEQCVDDPNGKNCSLTVSAEVTLPHLSSRACLELQPEEKQVGMVQFSLGLELKSVNCKFVTSTEYFTFPVKLRTSSALACANSEYCSWTRWCHAGYDRLPALQLFKELPSELQCQVTAVGPSTCAVFHSPACFHFVTYYEPIYSKAYEVRKIQSYSCEPEIEVTYTSEQKTEKRKLSGGGSVFEAITISQQGMFDTDTTLFTDYLIVDATKRVNWPVEEAVPPTAYLFAASIKGNPTVALVGDVQSATPTSKEFKFAQKLASCTVTDLKLHCVHKSPLERLDELTTALPRSFGNHLLSITGARELRSTLITSPGVRLSLQFQKLQVRLSTERICPILDSSSLEAKGCYNCDASSLITFTARSSCKAGPVKVTLADVHALQSTVTLSEHDETHQVLFKASTRCPQLRLCLYASPDMQETCAEHSTCLQEPEIKIPPLITEALMQAGPEVLPAPMNIGEKIRSFFSGIATTVMFPIYFLGAAACVVFVFALVISLLRR